MHASLLSQPASSTGCNPRWTIVTGIHPSLYIAHGRFSPCTLRAHPGWPLTGKQTCLAQRSHSDVLSGAIQAQALEAALAFIEALTIFRTPWGWGQDLALTFQSFTLLSFCSIVASVQGLINCTLSWTQQIHPLETDGQVQGQASGLETTEDGWQCRPKTWTPLTVPRRLQSMSVCCWRQHPPPCPISGRSNDKDVL